MKQKNTCNNVTANWDLKFDINNRVILAVFTPEDETNRPMIWLTNKLKTTYSASVVPRKYSDSGLTNWIRLSA